MGAGVAYFFFLSLSLPVHFVALITRDWGARAKSLLIWRRSPYVAGDLGFFACCVVLFFLSSCACRVPLCWSVDRSFFA